MDQIKKALEGKIGQRLADRINQETVVMGAIVAWLVGYFVDSLYITMLIFGASVVAALVACVPPWPMYRKYPVVWLPNRPSNEKAAKSQ
ncbi:microsomal signal peptidase 12 kDa subunit [Acaromyces ingoldii]|uniref:Signal peptidase complex subunit 1 n=1 Tax=Acaromyces ingoldii TaxID=215250 RepID=A0A316YQD1_9BASI|nr:microsomal signal peptidase 12 kDa subunit [Acaromyces ingoldii]PWN89965.1 microsomal signal peptidase 12 kDa subunit [Acaromyces ingoldii]